MHRLLAFAISPARMAARHHAAGIAAGLSLTFLGSTIAKHTDAIAEFLPWLSHVTIDVIAYAIHGFGLIPAYRHLEHVWDLFDPSQPVLTNVVDTLTDTEE